MSQASIAVCALAGLCLGTALALLFAECAWRMGEPQHDEPPITSLGHRAISWGGGIGLALLAVVYVLERAGLPCMQ